MNEILIRLKDDTVKRLNELAAAQGIPVEQEASALLESAVTRAGKLSLFVNQVDSFAANLPKQKTDSSVLIREDRDR